MKYDSIEFPANRNVGIVRGVAVSGVVRVTTEDPAFTATAPVKDVVL